MVLEAHHMMTDTNDVIVTGQVLVMILEKVLVMRREEVLVMMQEEVLVMMREEVQVMIKTTRGTVTMGEVLSARESSVIGDGKTVFLMGGNLMIVLVLMEKISLKLGRQIAKRVLVCPAFLLYVLLGRYWGRMLCLFASVSLQNPTALGFLMAPKLPR